MSIEQATNLAPPGSLAELVACAEKHAEAVKKLSETRLLHDRRAHHGTEPTNPNKYIVRPPQRAGRIWWARECVQNNISDYPTGEKREITQENPFEAVACGLTQEGIYGRFHLNFESEREPVDPSDPDPMFGKGYVLWRATLPPNTQELRGFEIVELDPDGQEVSRFMGAQLVAGAATPPPAR